MTSDRPGIKHTWIAALAALLLSATASSSRAATPSFDCESRLSAIEELICHDDVLAGLDMRLARRFARALAEARADEVASLRGEQRQWHARLLKCGQAESPGDCAKAAYDSRIERLAVTPTTASAAPRALRPAP